MRRLRSGQRVDAALSRYDASAPAVPKETPEERKARQKTARLAKKAFTDRECLYVIIHPLWPQYCKIGHTCNPVSRLSSFNTGDPLKRFEYAHIEDVYDRVLAERLVHNMLASYRKDTTEWFEMHHKDAARILGSLHSSTLIVSG